MMCRLTSFVIVSTNFITVFVKSFISKYLTYACQRSENSVSPYKASSRAIEVIIFGLSIELILSEPTPLLAQQCWAEVKSGEGLLAAFF